MVATAPIQQFSFIAGVLDTDMSARGDLKMYYAGVTTARNLIGLAQGGLKARGGTRNFFEMPSANGVRLVRFEFNEEQVYLLVCSPTSIAVFFNNSQTTSLVTPYLDSELAALNWHQSLDSLLLFHKNHHPRQLQRQGGHDKWAIANLALTNVPNFEFGRAFLDCGMSLSGLGTGSVTATLDKAFFLNPGDTSATIRAGTGVATISGFTSTSVATINVTTAFDKLTYPSGEWTLDKTTASTKNEPTWSDRRGYPSCGCFHQGRLVLAGLKSRPSTYFLSKAGSFLDFGTTTQQLDDESIEVTLDADQVPAINQVYSLQERLILFTSFGIYYMPQGDVTPKTATAPRTSQVRAANVRAVELENAPIFVRRRDDGKSDAIQELEFLGDDVGYEVHSLSILAGTLLDEPVDIQVRRGNRDDQANHLFVLNKDGQIPVLNSSKEQEVTQWTGPFDFGGTVRAMAIVGACLYIAIDRVINGVTRQYLEWMDEFTNVDSALKFSFSPAAAAVSGLGHLEGKSLLAWCDGLPVDGLIVTGGAVTLPFAASEVVIGLPIEFEAQTLPLLAELSNGTTIGEAHRIVRTTIDLREAWRVNVNNRAINLAFDGPLTFDGSKVLRSGLFRQSHLGWNGGRRDQGAVVSITGTAPAVIKSLTSRVGQ